MAESTLTSVPLFRDLPQKSIKRIERFARPRHFNAGDKIVSEGEEGLGFYMIQSGKVHVSRGGAALADLHEGEFFGEMALLDAHRRSATVTATEPTDCLVLMRSDFVAELEGNADLAIELLAIVSRRLHDANTRLAEL